MFSEEVIERFKAKIPALEGVCDYTVYGITHLDIENSDGSVRQIVLIFERLRVDEPPQFLSKKQIYADVYIQISDDVLADIAAKEIPLDDAIEGKLFKVHGDAEIWKLQLAALREILPNEHYKPRPLETTTDPQEEECETVGDWIDHSDLPQMDLSTVPEEFKFLTEPFEALRAKYEFKKSVNFHSEVKKS